MLQPAEFQAVFDSALFKVGVPQYLLLVRPNGLDHPRIGFVIAKKKVRRAVDRNRLKRTVRESFRLHQATLPATDIVFLARQDLADLSSSELTASLAQSWERMQRKLAVTSGASSGAKA